MARKSALGRGLGALIENPDEESPRRPAAAINEVPVESIDANPWQPRSSFDEVKLNELASSIRELGIVQPLTLRKVIGGRYQIIAGERRFKAAKIAGLTAVPAYVRDADDDAMLEMALVENIQREDLDPIEVAISYQRLIEECSLTQESLSERIGKNRSTIANHLRLLTLPAEVQLGLREAQISMGHARALIALKDSRAQLRMFDRIIKNDYTVRKVESLVREKSRAADEKKSPADAAPAEYGQLKQQLSEFFKTNIQFTRGAKGKGKIVIPFRSDEELEKIISILDKAKS